MIYVDQLQRAVAKDALARLVGSRQGHQWCHMWTDGDLEELHVFAEKIGMKRAWFQPHRLLPHYDLVPRRRAAALAAGAKFMDIRDWFRREIAARGLV